MSKSVRITLNQISGVANAYYDMLDQDQTYIFQQVYGASLSNGVTYSVPSTSYQFTIVSSNSVLYEPVVAQFNFNLTARSVSEWVDVSGHPHLSVITATAGSISLSTRSTTYWTNLSSTTAVQNGGEETANPSYIFPQNVVLDYYFSNQTVCGSGNEQIEISGLTPLGYYTLQILGSRNNANVADATRQVRYVIRHNGTRTTLAAFDVKRNTANYAEMVNVQADATGKFWVGSYGNNEFVNSAFAYFNAMKIISQQGAI